MLTTIGKRAYSWASAINPWTNVYGLARTLLALGTASTLLFSQTSTLFRPATGITDVPICHGLSKVSLFCQLPGHLELARWIAIALLLIVASGWRPRFTGVIHWWISSGLFTSSILVDGGDQATALFTLLLLPVTLTDGRRWHWEPATQKPPSGACAACMRVLALSTLSIIRLQVAAIYFQASVAKFKVPEWSNGTALYYWLTDPSFGVPGWLQPVVLPLLTNQFTVVLMTWGVLLVEIALFTGLVMPKRRWHYLLKLGITLHLGIAVFQGLVSFFFAMAAALILYLRPVEQPFELALLARLTKRPVLGLRRAAAALPRFAGGCAGVAVALARRCRAGVRSWFVHGQRGGTARTDG